MRRIYGQRRNRGADCLEQPVRNGVLFNSKTKVSGGSYYYRMLVNRYEDNNQGLYYIDGMYSIKAQKEKTSAARIATGVIANANSFPSLSKIKVSDFLNEVKDYYREQP